MSEAETVSWFLLFFVGIANAVYSCYNIEN